MICIFHAKCQYKVVSVGIFFFFSFSIVELKRKKVMLRHLISWWEGNEVKNLFQSLVDRSNGIYIWEKSEENYQGYNRDTILQVKMNSQMWCMLSLFKYQDIIILKVLCKLVGRKKHTFLLSQFGCMVN